MRWNRWTDRDNEVLPRLVAEGWGDTDVAYIMGFNRKAIAQHRRDLGLRAPPRKKPPKGWKHTDEARARISAAKRELWKDPAYKQSQLPHLAEATEASMRNRFLMPAERRDRLDYIKTRRVMGPVKAREAYRGQNVCAGGR